MILQLIIGTIMIITTVAIHAVALDYTIRYLKSCEAFAIRVARSFWKGLVIMIAVLMVFIAHVIQIWLWAMLFIWLGEFTDLEAALYFSTSTFTTVGYGDIFLQDQWRLLSSIEAANGFILFGWSTAFIFEIMSQLYRREASALKKDDK